MNTAVTSDDLSFTLVAGLGAEAIDERLRRTCRVADLGNRATAFYLADLHERGLHQVLGYPTTVAYAVRGLGMSRRQARELLHAGLRLRELPVLDGAFAESRLCWSKVRKLCRVVTPETEAAWLEKSLFMPQDELERLLRRYRPGDAPPDGTGMPQARFALHFDLDAMEFQMWENARAKLRAECGEEVELTDADVLREMLRLVLASDADGSVPGRKAVDGGPFRVIVRGDKVVGEDGEEPLAPASAEAIAGDAETSPALRRKILDRDGHRCVHCGGRRGLHAHHVEWRSKGGATTPANLITLCARCHSLVHQGFLDVDLAQGAASDPGPKPVFRDALGRRLERRSMLGARPLARCAGPAGISSAAKEPRPAGVSSSPDVVVQRNP
ncbi:MAG: HNH endonuclease [Planctomycetes bacterium]|nr:HNH endonuclease [Planctomycetota bacterium]